MPLPPLRNIGVTESGYARDFMSANFQHLRAFHAIAIEGGVSRAARRLNVSQPTLSQQLKALEARHRVALFESRKAPLRLTTAGHELFGLTTRLFATAADIDEALGESTNLEGGLLRLGSDNPTYAARLLAVFRRDHARTEVQVRLGNAREVMRWLDDAEIDVAIASDPPANGSLVYLRLAEDVLTCAVPEGHALAGLDAIPVAALARETLLIREPASKTRAFTERALVNAGIEPVETLQITGREAIREAIALGLGISVFFSSECPPDCRIAYRPLATGEHDYSLQSWVLYQSERRKSALMRAVESAVGQFATTGK